jgi:tricorn protease
VFMLASRKWLARFLVLASIALSGVLPALAQDSQEGRLMLFPDIYKDKVAFVYGGDIWLASTSGGVARRITEHQGRELFPKFSPDGKWIAFTGQYDGNFNVYVMPSDGGQPRQLTFYQAAHISSATAWESTTKLLRGRRTASGSSF